MNRHAASELSHHRENVAVVVDDRDDAGTEHENAFRTEETSC